MHSTLLIVASFALLAYCACAPTEEVIQHVSPPKVQTPSNTGKDGANSGAVGEESSEPKELLRNRRSIGGQESDLLPSGSEVDAAPFGGPSALLGRGRIRVLPAFLG
ncbi:uncharacterized protein LOC113231104 [Hyposmocoma kahamanoa]|uniref:uncharacterized protein LOC113231104 n=1 Tax=Hyposmocoma kahamanoa TaxID=1477025 RepID=UPI000E6D9CC1|nr:uncharacterized protein LOC113231104 [Hyposmocoma kahamanoa]